MQMMIAEGIYISGGENIYTFLHCNSVTDKSVFERLKGVKNF
jgi:hypothetical protein